MKTTFIFRCNTRHFILLLILLISYSCEKENPPVAASTEVVEVFDIMLNSARVFVNISDNGGTDIKSNGVCWSKSPNPDINDSTTEIELDIGGYIAVIENLEPSSAYYVRSYVDNGVEITYSNEIHFTTLDIPVFDGSIEIQSQAEFDLFANEGIQIVNGSLIISNDYYQREDEIFSIKGLNELYEVKVDLIIERIDEIKDLSSFKNLKSIGGSLVIKYNENLESILDLINLEDVKGSIVITDNFELESLEGLNSITEIRGNLIIDDNNRLTGLSGLENLTEIFGELSISYNDRLSSLMGLENLTSIGYALSIYYNPKLESIKGLGKLKNVESLTIGGNDSLRSLEGLDSVNSSGYISIWNNLNLINFCALQSLLKSSSIFSWSCDVSYNAFNPSCDEIRNGTCSN